MTSRLQPRIERHLRLSVLALAAGTAALSWPAVARDKESSQPKITLSAKFQPLYLDLAKKIDADKARADVVAAQKSYEAANDGAAQKAAQAQLAALVAPEKAQLATVTAAAATPDDKFAAAQLQLQLGVVSEDYALERPALEALIASGKAGPDETVKFQGYLGRFAYQAADYAVAIPALQAAIASGHAESDLNIILADSYLKNKQLDKGLPALQHAIDVQKASGQPVPVSWYRIGVVAAYNARLVQPTIAFGAGLIQQEPTKQNWALLIEVLQRVGGYPPGDELDLLRLMGRTHSYAAREDYLEYIQDADARRLPGEVLDVIAAGQASGMLNASDPAIAEAKSIAAGRVTADRASLVGLIRDARAPGANAATASGAGDAALSYGQSADAVALYKLALDKPGVDTPRVLTRLGIAQVDSGDYAGAQASFARITGPRQPLGQLWSIYATQKAAGK